MPGHKKGRRAETAKSQPTDPNEMPPKFKFQEGERVLCFHGPLLYEAKCVRAEAKDKAARYFIHYNGWNKNWDEWVPESRVLKFNEAGLQKQKELNKAQSGKGRSQKTVKGKKPPEKSSEKERSASPCVDPSPSTPTSTPASTPSSSRKTTRPGTSTTKDREKDKERAKEKNKEKPKEKDEPPRKKKSRLEIALDIQEEPLPAKIEVKIKMPEELKPWLADDYDLINKQHQLVSLPCKQTVDMILQDFIAYKLQKPNSPHKCAIVEMTRGIKEYFNVLLGTQLLYKAEREQYEQIIKDKADTPLTDIYGASHLLRLFVKLAGVLADSSLDEYTIQLLTARLHDLLKYLSRNMHTLFSADQYQPAPQTDPVTAPH